jgi:Protein of unknown function (DUF2914)
MAYSFNGNQVLHTENALTRQGYFGKVKHTSRGQSMMSFHHLSLSQAYTFFILVMTLASGPESPAQTPFKPASNSLSVQEILLATGMENLEPIGAGDHFNRTVGKLFCLTRITGARTDTVVRHLWFYGDRLMSEVSLPVKRINWRTFSWKTIQPEWTGSWRVDVTAEDGTLLKSVSFSIE